MPTRQEFESSLRSKIPDSPVKDQLINQMLRQYDAQTGYSGLETKFRDIINRPTQDLPMYEFLSQYLRGGAEKGMPYKADFLQSATGAIRSQYDTAGRNLQDRLSSRGLGSSGIGLVAQNQLQGQESGAINEATNQVNAQDLAFRQNAIAELLGLSRSQATYGIQQSGQSLSALNALYGYKQHANEFQTQLDAEAQRAQMEFWSRLLGTAGKAAGGLAAGGGGGGGGVFPEGSYDYAGSDASGYA